jgi:hypothetical protein
VRRVIHSPSRLARFNVDTKLGRLAVDTSRLAVDPETADRS